MKEFLIALDERVDIESRYLISEDQVLEYLKDNMDISTKLQEILDYELQDVCKQRPDIIDLWKYYKRFKYMLANNS